MKNMIHEMKPNGHSSTEGEYDIARDEYEFFLRSVYTRPYDLINLHYPLPHITNEIHISPFNKPIEVNFNILSFFKEQYNFLVPRFFKYPIKIIVSEHNDLNEIDEIYYTNSHDFEDTLIKINYFEAEKYNKLINLDSSRFLSFFKNEEKKFFLSIYNNLENIKEIKSIKHMELQIICDYFNKKPRNYEKIYQNILRADMTTVDLIRIFLLLSNEFNICLLKIMEFVDGDLLFIFSLSVLNLLENASMFEFKKIFYVHLILKYILQEFLKNKNNKLLETLNQIIVKYTLFDSFYFFITNLYLNRETATEMFLLSNSNEKQHLIVSASNILNTEVHCLFINNFKDIKLLENTNENQTLKEKTLKLNINYIPEKLIKEIQINCAPTRDKYEIINQNLFIYFPICYNFLLESIKIKTKNFLFIFEVNLNI